MVTEPRLARKSFSPAWSGSLYYLFTFLAVGAFSPFVWVYLTDLGLSGKQVGLLSIFSPVMTMLLSTVIATQADRRHKRRRYAQVGLAGVGVTLFLLRFPTTFNGIAALLVIYSIFNSPVMGLAEGLIARAAQRYNLNYGSLRLWGSFGFAVSAVAFGAIWQSVGYQPMFLTTALFFLPLIWITGKLEEGPAITQEKHMPLVEIFKNSGTLLLLLATILSGISNYLFMTFGGIYASYLGGGNLLIGLVMAFGALAELPAMFYSGKLANRLGKTNTAILSYGLMALAYLGYSLSAEANYLLGFSILKGLGYALWITVTVRLLIERTPEEWTATVQSLLAICWFGLSPLVAGPLGGWIYDAVSPAAVFRLGVVTLGLAAIVLWFARARGKLE